MLINVKTTRKISSAVRMLSGALVAILRSVRPLWECHTHLNFGYMIHDKTLVLLADEMILTFLGKLAPLIDGNAV